jgi:RNA polymerase sigma factor (sigma-70 family)
MPTTEVPNFLPTLPSEEALRKRLLARRTELLGLLRRFPHEVAENAVQEALVQEWQALQRGDERVNWTAWSRSVAVNAARKQLRRTPTCALCECHEPSIDPFEQLDRQEERDVILSLVLEQIEKLPEHLRAVFKFYAVEGHTLAETKAEFRLKRGVISGMLSRARIAIRRALGVPPQKKPCMKFV